MFPYLPVPDTVFATPTLVEPVLVRPDHLRPVVLLAAPPVPDAASPAEDDDEEPDTVVDE